MRVSLVIALAACGGGSATTPLDGAGATDGTTTTMMQDGGTGPASCDSPAACGGTCGMCRFAPIDIGTFLIGSDPIALVDDDTVLNGATLATKGTPWTSEAVSGAERFVGAGRAPDGSLWALSSQNDAQLGHLVGGTWTFQSVGIAVWAAAFAMTPDGNPVIAYSGGVPPDGATGVAIAVGPTFALQKIASTQTQPDWIAVAVAPDGTPWVAYRDETTKLLMIGTSTLAPVTATTTAIDDLGFALVIEADGPHVFRRNDSVMNGHALLDTHRDGSGWTTDQLFALTIGSAAGLRAAQAPNGDLAVAFIHDNATYLASRAGGSWFLQEISTCSSDNLDVAWTHGNAIAVASSCGLIETTGAHFPASQLATCQAIAASACPKACACNTNSCRVTWTGGGQSAGPESNCERRLVEATCGDATMDPAIAPACAAAVDGASCTSGNPLALPDSCAL